MLRPTDIENLKGNESRYAVIVVPEITEENA